MLLRESGKGLETLLLKRNKALMFAGGYWVFPVVPLTPRTWPKPGRRTAGLPHCRRQGGLGGIGPASPAEDMVLISHWTTPVAEPKRFST